MAEQRRYGAKKKVADNYEKPYRMAPAVEKGWDDLFQVAPDLLKPVVGGAAAIHRGSEQAQRNILSGIGQIPGDVAGIIDLVRVGVPAVVQNIGVPPQDEEARANIGAQIANDFARGVFSDEARANVEQHLIKKAQDFVASTEGLDEEQLSAMLDQYQDSREFFDFMTSQMSPGFRLAQYSNAFMNDLFGTGKRPDEQTIIDDIEQLTGQSIVGLPASVLKGLGKQARKLVGDAVLDSVTGKIALRAGELVTPLTLPLNPSNIALNTAAGAAISELTRDLTGMPSFLNGEIADFVTELDPPDGHGINVGGQIDQDVVSNGFALGSLFAFPAFRRKAAQDAASSAEKAVRDLSTNAGPTLSDQVDRLDPLLSPTTGLIDANAPVKKAANQFEADTEVLDLLDARMSAASTVNRMESEVRAVNYGILDGLEGGTIPLVEIQRAARGLSEDEYDLLNKYFYAQARNKSTEIYGKGLTEQLHNARMDFAAARDRNDTRAMNAARQKMTEIQQALTDLERDIPTSRKVMQNWSRNDVQNIMSVASANEKVMQVAKAMDKVFQDITEFKRVNGYIDDAEAERLRKGGVLLIRERQRADVENPIARRALLMKDRVFRQPKDPAVDPTDMSLSINRPKDSLVTLQENLMEAVRDVAANNARRTVVDTLKGLPNAEGTLLRPFEFNLGQGRKSHSISQKQFNKIGRDQIEEAGRDRFVRIVRDGKVEYWEFSDLSIAKSLQFAPLASVPIANITRKVWQSFTTGLWAPWFAVKSALWDVNLAKTTSRQGRSLGLLDTYARRLFNESSAVNLVGDHIYDPTAVLSVTLAIPYQMAMRSARSVGIKIASDLANKSGVFHMMAQVPGGMEMLAKTGTWMQQTFDRSVFNVMSRNLSTTLTHLTDATQIADDYVVRGRGTTLGNRFKSTINAYKAMVESIQNSTRTAFFYENYTRLRAKHGGTVPQKELDKLVQETRNLTGDMSRVSNSKFIQGLSSVVPYSNPVLQGTRHILSATIPPSGAKLVNKVTGGKANMLENRTNKFWTQFTSGVLLPSLGAYAILDGWGAAQDWWYNKVPEWQRFGAIPLPTYEALEYYFENGEWPEFDPDKHMHMVPMAPELSLIKAPIEAALRSMGVFGPASTVMSNGLEDLKNAFAQLTNIATPPLIQAGSALFGMKVDFGAISEGGNIFQPTNDLTFGGINADKMTWNSQISKQLFDVIGALTSSSGQMITQTLNVFGLAAEETGDLWNAADKALDTWKYEATRRLPDVPGLPGVSRNYAFTPESQFVFDTERVLEPLIGNGRQRTVELDSKDRIESLESKGLIPPEKISEPLLRRLTEEVYGALRKKGPFKQASEQYTELRVELNGIEATRYRWPTELYHKRYNEIVANQQQLKAVQSKILSNLETDLNDKYGPIFQQLTGTPFSYKTLVEAVKKDVGT